MLKFARSITYRIASEKNKSFYSDQDRPNHFFSSSVTLFKDKLPKPRILSIRQKIDERNKYAAQQIENVNKLLQEKGMFNIREVEKILKKIIYEDNPYYEPAYTALWRLWIVYKNPFFYQDELDKYIQQHEKFIGPIYHNDNSDKNPNPTIEKYDDLCEWAGVFMDSPLSTSRTPR